MIRNLTGIQHTVYTNKTGGFSLPIAFADDYDSEYQVVVQWEEEHIVNCHIMENNASVIFKLPPPLSE